MSRATNSERSPLLRIKSRQSDAPFFSVTDVGPSTFWVTALCLLLAALQQIAVELLTPAVSYFNEVILCRSVYGDATGSTNDWRCTEPIVQSQLSTLNTFDGGINMVVVVLVSIPIGVAADRFGRKPFLVLALISGMLNMCSRALVYRLPETFSVRLVWLAASLELFGGGRSVFSAMLYTILTDSTAKPQRTNAFFYLMAANTVGDLVGASLAGRVTQSLGPWPSLLSGINVLFFTTLCACCMPETIPLRKSAHTGEASGEDSAAKTVVESSRGAVYAGYKRTASSMAALFRHNKKLAIFLVIVPFTAIGTDSLDIISPYIDERYELALETIQFIDKIRAIFTLILTAALLLVVRNGLLSYCMPAFHRDISLARFGILAATLGLFGIGLSPTLGLFMFSMVGLTFNTAYDGSMKSIQSQLVGNGNVATMFTVRSVLEKIGGSLGGPLMTVFQNIGLEHGKAWFGLPFLAGGCFYAFTAIVVFAVSFAAPNKTQQRGADEVDQDE